MEETSPIVLVSGGDEGYAIPLAVTLRTAIDCLKTDRNVKIYILDGGISDVSRRKIVESCQDPRVTIDMVSIDTVELRGLPVSDHISSAAYLRLLIPEVLPETVERVIYFDADMIIKRDLALLWETDQAGHSVLAVQDFAAPYLDSSVAIDHFDQVSPFLAANNPVPNFQALNMAPDEMYFNTGLLVIDVNRWRKDQVGPQALQCLKQHRSHVLWWDQYALNVVLYGQWGLLDRRWNQGAHIHVYPSQGSSPFASETYQQTRDDPWIVHFTSPSKPWHFTCDHPATAEFYECLDRTVLAGWRPQRPRKSIRELWDDHYQPARQQWKVQTRKLKSRLGYRRKAA